MSLLVRSAISVVVVLAMMLPVSAVNPALILASANGSAITVEQGRVESLNAKTSRVFVANTGSGTMSVIDGSARL